MTSIIPCDQILGEKSVEARLGAGRFGEVFRAKENRRDVALKCVGSLDGMFDEEFAMHFQLSQRIPGVCKLFGMCKNHPTFGTCFVMKLYVGSLDDEIARGALTPHRAVDVGAAIAETIELLHRLEQILIADLKPANVLIDEHGRPFLSDFGVSQKVETAMLSRGISSAKVTGTIHYMSMEQLGGEDEDDNPLRVTLKSDTWSYGCTVVHMLSGHLPWIDTATGAPLSEKKVMSNVVLRMRSPPLDDVPSDAPAELVELLHACLTADPAARPAFTGADGVAARMASILVTMPASVVPHELPYERAARLGLPSFFFSLRFAGPGDAQKEAGKLRSRAIIDNFV